MRHVAALVMCILFFVHIAAYASQRVLLGTWPGFYSDWESGVSASNNIIPAGSISDNLLITHFSSDLDSIIIRTVSGVSGDSWFEEFAIPDSFKFPLQAMSSRCIADSKGRIWLLHKRELVYYGVLANINWIVELQGLNRPDKPRFLIHHKPHSGTPEVETILGEFSHGSIPFIETCSTPDLLYNLEGNPSYMAQLTWYPNHKNNRCTRIPVQSIVSSSYAKPTEKATPGFWAFVGKYTTGEWELTWGKEEDRHDLFEISSISPPLIHDASTRVGKRIVSTVCWENSIGTYWSATAGGIKRIDSGEKITKVRAENTFFSSDQKNGGQKSQVAYIIYSQYEQDDSTRLYLKLMDEFHFTGSANEYLAESKRYDRSVIEGIKKRRKLDRNTISDQILYDQMTQSVLEVVGLRSLVNNVIFNVDVEGIHDFVLTKSKFKKSIHVGQFRISSMADAFGKKKFRIQLSGLPKKNQYQKYSAFRFRKHRSSSALAP